MVMPVEEAEPVEEAVSEEVVPEEVHQEGVSEADGESMATE